jgi:hypothetical protein
MSITGYHTRRKPINPIKSTEGHYRILHLSGKGGPPDPQHPEAWQKSQFGQDANHKDAGVWAVAEKDGGENNSDWYRCVFYNGEPPAWPGGIPIASSGDFQLPKRGNEQVITVDLDPVSQPLELAGFQSKWDETGPAELKDLKRVEATSERGTYDLNLHHTRTNVSKRVRCEYKYDEIEGKAGEALFHDWLLVDEQPAAI